MDDFDLIFALGEVRSGIEQAMDSIDDIEEAGKGTVGLGHVKTGLENALVSLDRYDILKGE